MTVRVKVPPAVKELADGVSSFLQLAGQTLGSGRKAVRQAEKTARRASRTVAAVGDVARAGRDAASRIGAAAREAEAEIDLEHGSVVVDLRGNRVDDGNEGNDR